jgi:hypothetical protein
VSWTNYDTALAYYSQGIAQELKNPNRNFDLIGKMAFNAGGCTIDLGVRETFLRGARSAHKNAQSWGWLSRDLQYLTNFY